MNILVYSFNDKIGDGLQKITFLQKLKDIYPNSLIYYTTSQTTTLKDKLNPLVKDIIHNFIEHDTYKWRKNYIWKFKFYINCIRKFCTFRIC